MKVGWLELHLDGDLVWRVMNKSLPGHTIDDDAKNGPHPDEEIMSTKAKGKGVEVIGLEHSSSRVKLRLSHPRHILLELKARWV